MRIRSQTLKKMNERLKMMSGSRARSKSISTIALIHKRRTTPRMLTVDDDRKQATHHVTRSPPTRHGGEFM